VESILAGGEQQVDQRQHVGDEREFDVVLEERGQQCPQVPPEPFHLSPFTLGVGLEREQRAVVQPCADVREDVTGEGIAERR
jgi:hypothetical protein